MASLHRQRGAGFHALWLNVMIPAVLCYEGCWALWKPAAHTNTAQQPLFTLSHAVAMEMIALSQTDILQTQAREYQAAGGPFGTLCAG